jgi:hypothetical protein
MNKIKEGQRVLISGKVIQEWDQNNVLVKVENKQERWHHTLCLQPSDLIPVDNIVVLTKDAVKRILKIADTIYANPRNADSDLGEKIRDIIEGAQYSIEEYMDEH